MQRHLWVVSEIDAAKVRHLFRICKKSDLQNSSILPGTVFNPYSTGICSLSSEGDVAYVAQLQGGRLPEGSTTLPKGFSFKFIKATIVAPKKIEDALYEAYAEGQWAGDNGHAAQVVNEIKEKYSL